MSNKSDRDIERNPSELKLHGNEQCFRALFELAPFGCTVNDLEGRYLMVNEAFCRHTGLSTAEAIGRTGFELGLIPDPLRFEGLREEIIRLGVVTNREGMLTNRRGDVLRFLYSSRVVELDGNPVIITAATDITEIRQSEQLLRESETKLYSIFRAAPIGIGILGPDRRFHSGNDLTMEMLGYSSDELVGKGLEILYFTQEEYERCGRALYSDLWQGCITETETRMRRKDGTELHVLLRAAALNSDNPNLGVVVTVLDMTERKRAEEKLRESEAFFRSLLSATPAGVGMLRDRIFEGVNTALCKITGYTETEMLGGSTRILYPDDEEFNRVGLALYREMEEKGLGVSEARLQRKDGTVLNVLLCLSPIDLNDLTAGACATVLDITERKQTEKALAESERQYRSLFDNAIEGIFRTTLDGRIIMLNPAMAQMLGYSSPEDAMRSVTDIADQVYADPEERRVLISRLVQEERILGSEALLKRPDGQHVKVMLNFLLVKDAEGKPSHLEGSGIDITARWRAEEALKAREEMYRKLVAAVPDIILRTDLHGNITFVNENSPLFVRYFSGKNLIGNNIVSFVAVSDQARAEDDMAAMLKNSIGVKEYTLDLGNGTNVSCEVNGTIVSDDQGNPLEMVFIVRDTTERKKAEDALVKSEKRYRDMTDLLPQVIFETDLDGNITYVNKSAYRIFGYTEEDIKDGMNALSVFSHEDRLRAFENLRKVINGECHIGHEYDLLKKDGTRIPVVIYSSLIEEDGRPTGIRGIVIDLTEIRLAEEAQIINESKFRAIYDQTSHLAGILDSQGTLLETNRMARDYVVEDESSFIGRPFWLTPWWSHSTDDQSLLKAGIERAAKGEFVQFETTHRNAQGGLRYIDFSIKPVLDRSGKVFCLIPEGRDITERKLSENALRESEERFRTIFDQLSLGFAITEPSGSWLYFNDGLCRLTGYDRSELERITWKDLTPPEELKEEMICFEQLLNEDCKDLVDAQIEKRYVAKDGSLVDVFITTRILRNPDGSIKYLTSIIQDITERKRAEKALRENEELLRTTFNTTADGILVVGRDGRVSHMNRRFAQMWKIPQGLQYAGEDAGELTAFILDQLEDPEAFLPRIGGLYESCLEGTDEVRFKDGKVFEEYSSPIIIGGQVTGRVWDYRDITGRKRVEAELRESQEMLAGILNAVPQSIFWKDRSSVYLGCNQHFTRMAGLASPEHVVGKTDYDLPWSRAEADAYRQDDQQVISMNQSKFHIIETLRSADGNRLWTDTTKVPLKDTEGNPCGVLGIFEDITERKRAEEMLEFERAQLLSIFDSIDEIIYISDPRTYEVLYVNRPVQEAFQRTIIGGPCYRELQGLSSPCSFCTNDIIVNQKPEPYRWEHHNQTLDRYYSIVDRIITWPDGRDVRFELAIDITERKRAEAEREKLRAQLTQAQKMESIGRLAGGVAHDFNNMLGVIIGYAELGLGKKELVEPLRKYLQGILNAAGLPGTGLWQVRMDPTQVDQILANLCVNARDAIADIGRITIGTANTVLDESHRATFAELVPGEYVMLSVSDDGCGMSEDIQAQIFEPFFTTKGARHGTGLGLATVYGIVKQNNGLIGFDSERGHGTTFRICIPRCVDEPVEKMPAGEPEIPTGHGETILLVEDEPVLLEVSRTMLESLGYVVLTAAMPDEAIQRAEEHSGKIYLLMTDMVMPGMNGKELAERLQSTRPTLRRLFMSGYTSEAVVSQGALDEGVHYLQKPFSIQGLASKVREVLGN